VVRTAPAPVRSVGPAHMPDPLVHTEVQLLTPAIQHFPTPLTHPCRHPPAKRCPSRGEVSGACRVPPVGAWQARSNVHLGSRGLRRVSAYGSYPTPSAATAFLPAEVTTGRERAWRTTISTGGRQPGSRARGSAAQRRPRVCAGFAHSRAAPGGLRSAPLPSMADCRHPLRAVCITASSRPASERPKITRRSSSFECSGSSTRRPSGSRKTVMATSGGCPAIGTW
jgi:hypothetical protein